MTKREHNQLIDEFRKRVVGNLNAFGERLGVSYRVAFFRSRYGTIRCRFWIHDGGLHMERATLQ